MINWISFEAPHAIEGKEIVLKQMHKLTKCSKYALGFLRKSPEGWDVVDYSGNHHPLSFETCHYWFAPLN